MKRGDELVEELTAMIIDTTPPPADMVDRVKAHMTARREQGCECTMISCVCAQVKEHKDGCRYRYALLCLVGIECAHGFDVCRVCDPCTCKELP